MTRAEAATCSDLVAGRLAECANMLQYLAQACEQGMRSAREHGANMEALRDARELHERVERMRSFVHGEKVYADYLASLVR